MAFAVRLSTNCVCSRDGRFQRRIIQNEGGRYPELFAGWRQDGPNRVWSTPAATLSPRYPVYGGALLL